MEEVSIFLYRCSRSYSYYFLSIIRYYVIGLCSIDICLSIRYSSYCFYFSEDIFSCVGIDSTICLGSFVYSSSKYIIGIRSYSIWSRSCKVSYLDESIFIVIDILKGVILREVSVIVIGIVYTSTSCSCLSVLIDSICRIAFGYI